MQSIGPFTLRAATNADQTAVWSLISQVLGSYGIATDLASTDQDLANIEANYSGNQGALFVLVDGEKPIGTVAVRRESDTSCELCRMYLSPEYRGHGLGRGLLSVAEEHARVRGFTEMRLKTATALEEAIRLYESVGFVRSSSASCGNNSKCNVTMFKQLL